MIPINFCHPDGAYAVSFLVTGRNRKGSSQDSTVEGCFCSRLLTMGYLLLEKFPVYFHKRLSSKDL